ncbi:TPA: hypothetical protein RQO70_000649 [Klebsiella michiganensis]|nr:hypothetical protein [Klebsiella michiganensis]HDX9088993.1 hypothetical protein [Klebsiella michiganensis]
MPSGRFPGGGAMRLSGLQNPQAARPVAPVSIARPGNIPGSRLTPYPGYEIARPTRSQPPSSRFPGGGAMRLSVGNEYTRRAPWSGALSHNSA